MKTIQEKIEVMQAYLDGKMIEFKHIHDPKYHKWNDCNFKPNWDWINFDYRVKPEQKYAPFDTAEEFLTAQRVHGEGLISKYDDCVMKAHNISVSLDGFVYDHTEKQDGSNCLCMGDLEDLFIDYNFADGTPCGKEVIK